MSVSLVIPVHNEAGNLLPLVTAAIEVLQALGRDYEIILVNDGSSDGTPAEIAALHARWPQCRELTMPAHAGQAAALLAGLGAAKGDLLITMDGDGQNDPRDIPSLLGLVGSEQRAVSREREREDDLERHPDGVAPERRQRGQRREDRRERRWIDVCLLEGRHGSLRVQRLAGPQLRARLPVRGRVDPHLPPLEKTREAGGEQKERRGRHPSVAQPPHRHGHARGM